MRKVRFTFEKTQSAVYISHLDLMRCLQRAMTRAKIPAWHTEGYNPHPFISVTQALSLGYHAKNELADIQITDDGFPLSEFPARMNAVLPAGLRVGACRVSEKPAKMIEYAEYLIEVGPVSECDKKAMEIRRIFSAPKLILSKKTKRGEAETDIIPMIYKLDVRTENNRIFIDTVACCTQSAALNPELILRAIGGSAEDYGTNSVRITRTCFYDGNMHEFQ